MSVATDWVSRALGLQENPPLSLSFRPARVYAATTTVVIQKQRHCHWPPVGPKHRKHNRYPGSSARATHHIGGIDIRAFTQEPLANVLASTSCSHVQRRQSPILQRQETING